MALAAPIAPTSDKALLHKMAGCYLVDYNFTETQSLNADYQLDQRVYDVNETKTVKEWIYSEEITPNRVRVQHVLFATNSEGDLMSTSLLKHQAEDWEYAPATYFHFTEPGVWEAKAPISKDHWVRKVTNLDDGLRYQCEGKWNRDGEYPEFSCENYAPIPGREFRDMGRKDYQTLDRSTRIILYPTNFLERQFNKKVVHKDGKRTELAKEWGKTWYVKLPDSECAGAIKFASERKVFWNLLRETWDEVFHGISSFQEFTPPGNPPRYVKITEIEKEFLKKPFTNAKERILAIIRAYRK